MAIANPARAPAPSAAPPGPEPPRRPEPRRRGRPRPAAGIELEAAGKRFDDTWVVRQLSLKVELGTVFGLFGPSGSGKTTTIRMILGLLGLDEGRARVLGTD